MINEATVDYREAVFDAMATATTTKATALQFSSKQQHRLVEVKASAHAAAELVQKTARTLRQAVTAMEMATNAQITALMNTKLMTIANQTEEGRAIAEHVTAGVAFANAAMDTCSPAERLILKPLLVEGLAIMVNRGQSLVPLCAPHIVAVETAILARAVAAIAGAVHVVVGDTTASESTMSGDGWLRAVVGERSEFLVTTYDSGANRRTVGGDSVEVALAPTSGCLSGTSGASTSTGGSHVAVDGTVLDNNNGTYTCSYMATAEVADNYEGRGNASVTTGHHCTSRTGGHHIMRTRE
jgi:hypothetical protein